VTTSRVVLLDPGGGLEPVREALRDCPGVSVERAQRLPREPGVVGLLVPPEIPVDAAAMDALPDVRIVAATATGYDHLDLEAISAAGAWATHCPGYCTEEVAEHAIAFALDLLRGVTLLDRFVRAGGWDVDPAPPRRVSGTVLGIVGLGRIGRAVARRAQALEMRVVGFDPAIPARAVDGANGLGGVQVMPLHALLAQAEVVTLHAMLVPGAPPVLGAPELAMMRPGAYLINCARAGLVDTDALGEALRNNRLAGCALDVLSHEPPADDEPELGWPRTLINPHAAWYSPAAANEPYRRAGEAVAAVLSGREPADALARPD
jgi:D-3-phosphoglycerate dehydrogenase / 2-oxoglutarate reductase